MTRTRKPGFSPAKFLDPSVTQTYTQDEKFRPIPGKAYDLRGSHWIVVDGWKFRFGKAVIVTSKRTGKSWLSFSTYIEAPRIVTLGGKKLSHRELPFSLILRSMRISGGRLMAAFAPYGRDQYYHPWMLGRTLSTLVYRAIKEWHLVKDNPEFGIDSTKDPVGSLVYSLGSANMAMGLTKRDYDSWKRKQKSYQDQKKRDEELIAAIQAENPELKDFVLDDASDPVFEGNNEVNNDEFAE